MNSITIKQNGQAVTIETDQSVEKLQDLIANLIIPCLLGMTYSDKLIAEYFDSCMVD